MNAPEKVCYYDRRTEVMLGDHVQIRIWFRKLVGRVIYVPGKSKPNPAMDFNGIYSVGIQITRGPFIATNVQPDGNYLKKKVVFLKRDPKDFVELDSKHDPFEEET